MEHLTTTIDVRDLDCLQLATIGGVDYYEVRQIVRSVGGVRSVVGRASDWPLIQRDARITELTALLTAAEQRSVEADCHVAELLSRLGAYEEQIAVRVSRRRDGGRLDTRDDGKIPCDHPGCLNWVSPRGLGIHKRKAHGVISETGHKPSMAADQSPSVDKQKKCPYCRSRPKLSGMDAHIARAHPERLATEATVGAEERRMEGPLAITLGERPWACDRCHESTHARSLSNPALCIRCVVASADVSLTNGHLAAA